MSKEFFWCGKLTKSQPEMTVCLTPGNIPADSENFRTAVILKHIILGPTENKDLNVIELSGKGFEENKVNCVMACLQATESRSFDQTRLDLTLTDESKLKLVKGEGPVSILGQFILDFLGSPSDNEIGKADDDEDDDDDDDEDEEADIDEEENLETPSPPAPKKRKPSKSALPKGSKSKKSKNANSDSEEESKASKVIEKPNPKTAQGTAKRGRKI